jgi:hypothetical protein
MKHLSITDKQSKLIVETLSNIRKYQGHFCMQYYIRTNTGSFSYGYNRVRQVEELPVDLEKLYECDTSMCFAGWLVYTDYLSNPRELPNTPTWDFAKYALGVLGYTDKEINDATDISYSSISEGSSRYKDDNIAARILHIFFSLREIKDVDDLEYYLRLAEIID